MTAWHRRWQELCVRRAGWLTEALVEAAGELHIADAVSAGGLILEFQHSRITADEVLARNTAHHPLSWVLDATDASRYGAIGNVGDRFAWMSPPNWLPELVTVSKWVLIDLGDRVVRIREPRWHGAACSFSTTTVTCQAVGDSGDEYRDRLLAVVDLLQNEWDRAEFLDWVLSDLDEHTTYLADRGTTPGHALVWLNGAGTLTDLIDVHRTANTVGWMLPSNVFDTDHGSWLEKLANCEGDYYTVERWFDHAYARKRIDDAGVPAGPAAEWCNSNRDPDMLIEVHRRLTAIGSGLDVVWNQHKAHLDTAWKDLKEADSEARKRHLDQADRARSIDDWAKFWCSRLPYR